MPSSPSEYKAPNWLPGGDLQTIAPAETFAKPKVQYRREIWTTPDNDVVAVDCSCPEPLNSDAPVMVHFHGLEGSSKSHYALALMQACARNGWRGLVVHYRGCGGLENRRLRSYCAADPEELDWIFARIRNRYPQAKIFGMGCSLGANNLLFWLGKRSEDCNPLIDAAVAVSCPMDLNVSCEHLKHGLGVVYEANFLRTLKRKAIQKIEEFPGCLDYDAVRNAWSLTAYDEAVTSQLLGYQNARDYYAACSSRQYLGGITVPTLVVSALNDPVVGSKCLPLLKEVSGQVSLEYSREGGHCGFPLGPFPGSLGYLPKRTLDYCKQFL